jgi:predicted ribosomally synthesized peptide with SipW-like signal peptide
MSQDDSNKRYDLSRRTVLGSLGVAGAGAALGGVGTQAFFSDQETFTDNQLVAGSLDMKVDWEEHYSDWSEDEVEGVDWRMVNGTNEVMDDEHAFPQIRNATLAVNNSDVGQFMNNTAQEAFPDQNGDNLVDRGGVACTDFADAPEDLPAPVISLDDVKPGDFGEVTFSFHLCDNPGYVWMNGQLIADDEVSVNEPEADDPDEDDTPGGQYDAMSGEMAESIQAAVWYDDDCDNVYDKQDGTVDAVLAVDRSGSLSQSEWDELKSALETAIDDFDDQDMIGMVLYGDSPQAVDFGGSWLQTVGGNRQAIKDAIPDTAPDGTDATHMPGAIDFANHILDTYGMSDRQTIVLFTDGNPNYQNGTVDDGAEPPGGDTDDQLGVNFTYDGGTASEDSTISQSELDETVEVATAAKADGTQIVTVGLDTNDPYLRDQIASVPQNHFATENPANLENIYDVIVLNLTTGDKLLCQGSLGEVLADLNSNEGRGLPLDAARDYDGNTDTYDYDEKVDAENDEDRQCYPATTTACVAFEWWLPLDHANELQTDSAEFDLGFYTEQCRHNDGAGMVPETEQTPTESPTPIPE